MDVVSAYLYGILDTTIHMQAPPKLIERIKFHIMGEKISPLPPDIKSGISQLVPTSNEMNLIQHQPVAHANELNNGHKRDTTQPANVNQGEPNLYQCTEKPANRN